MREEAEEGWGNGRNSVGEYERNFTESASGGIKNKLEYAMWLNNQIMKAQYNTNSFILYKTL